ncbi:hypothetical protein NKH18_13575 [Streptomyces sp. M10(2022)]
MPALVPKIPDPEATRMQRTTNGQQAGELPDPRKGRAGGVVPVLAFAGITVAVMQTLLVPVIKDLPALLGTSPANATWVMTATLLAGPSPRRSWGGSAISTASGGCCSPAWPSW